MQAAAFGTPIALESASSRPDPPHRRQPQFRRIRHVQGGENVEWIELVIQLEGDAPGGDAESEAAVTNQGVVAGADFAGSTGCGELHGECFVTQRAAVGVRA